MGNFLIVLFSGLFLFSCAKQDGSRGIASDSIATELAVLSDGDFSIVEIQPNDGSAPADSGGQNFQEKYSLLTDLKWSNGVISWYYNPQGQPIIYTTTQLVDILKAAAQKWSAVCGVTFQYMGPTSSVPNFTGRNGVSAVGWENISYSGYAQFWTYNNAIVETDIKLDPDIQSVHLSRIVTHEFGHSLGIGHNDLNTQLMFATVYATELQSEDVAACQAKYGPPKSSTPTVLVCTAGATQTCAVSNGAGRKTCSSDGMSWGVCQATSCNSGYTLQNGTCRRDKRTR
ncbi:MAG: matrixin family metalloprotease [Bdellovibrionota bacterium]